MEPSTPPEQTPPTNPEPATNPTPPQAEASAAPTVAAPAPEVTNEPLPSTWPGGFGLYKYSKQAIKLNVWTIVGWWLVIAAVTTLLRLELKNTGQAISSVVDVLGTTIATLLYLASVRRQKVGFFDVINQALRLWLKMVVLSFLVALSIAVSFLLLIIPVFFIAPRLALANYFLVDKNMGILEAYKASWHATKGNVGKVYGIVGASFAMALLMLTIIGIPFAIYFLIMYSAAFAILYEMLLKQPAALATQANS